ncbi:MAG: hypothetical protein ACPH5V_00105 [Alcanivorax sp.]
MTAFLSWVDRLYNRHKFARRSTLLLVQVLLTLTVLQFLDMAREIPGSDNVFISIIGLLAIAITMYQRGRERDER